MARVYTRHARSGAGPFHPAHVDHTTTRLMHQTHQHHIRAHYQKLPSETAPSETATHHRKCHQKPPKTASTHLPHQPRLLHRVLDLRLLAQLLHRNAHQHGAEHARRRARHLASHRLVHAHDRHAVAGLDLRVGLESGGYVCGW